MSLVAGQRRICALGQPVASTPVRHLGGPAESGLLEAASPARTTGIVNLLRLGLRRRAAAPQQAAEPSVDAVGPELAETADGAARDDIGSECGGPGGETPRLQGRRTNERLTITYRAAQELSCALLRARLRAARTRLPRVPAGGLRKTASPRAGRLDLSRSGDQNPKTRLHPVRQGFSNSVQTEATPEDTPEAEGVVSLVWEEVQKRLRQGQTRVHGAHRLEVPNQASRLLVRPEGFGLIDRTGATTFAHPRQAARRSEQDTGRATEDVEGVPSPQQSPDRGGAQERSRIKDQRQ